MFGIGGFELFIILVFGFLIFGPDKLPEIAKTVGKAIARFRSAQDEMNSVIKSTDIFDPNDPEQPFKDPVAALDKLAKHQEEKNSGKKSETSASTSASASAASTAGAASETSTTGAAGAAKQESFTERKARYERERAARKAAEAKAAEEAAKAEEAAAQASDAAQPAAKPAATQDAAGAASPASAQADNQPSSASTEGGDE